MMSRSIPCEQANLAASLISMRVLDEIRLELNPTIPGGGKPLLGHVDRRSKPQLMI